MQNETLSNFEGKLLLIRSKNYCKKYFATWIYSWNHEEGSSTGRSSCVRVAIVDRILSIDLLFFMEEIIQMNLMVAIFFLIKIQILMAQSITSMPIPPPLYICHFFFRTAANAPG